MVIERAKPVVVVTRFLDEEGSCVDSILRGFPEKKAPLDWKDITTQAEADIFNNQVKAYQGELSFKERMGEKFWTVVKHVLPSLYLSHIRKLSIKSLYSETAVKIDPKALKKKKKMEDSWRTSAFNDVGGNVGPEL